MNESSLAQLLASAHTAELAIRAVGHGLAAGKCTDVKFAVRQLFKLWRKLGLLP